MSKFTIASRGSKLALWQSTFIQSEIAKTHGIEVGLDIYKTQGDKILDVPLAKIGGKGLFTKELEEAMLAGTAHIAVHSLKDVPTDFIEGLTLAAVTEREDSRDLFLSAKYTSLDVLPHGAVVGTTSLRRKMQLLAYRADLVIKDLRGNVDTRINKLNNGEYDAIILAAAGMNRLGLRGEVAHTHEISKEIMVPAMGQAALGIEAVDTPEVLAKVAFLNHETTMIETTIERDFVRVLQGGCQVPIGVNAEVAGEQITVRAIIGMPDGSNMIKQTKIVALAEYATCGKAFAEEFLALGAREILDRACEVAFN